MRNLKIRFTFFLSLVSGISNLFAQKLPELQPGSVSITQSINIDGKFSEWEFPFQAYNKAVELYYTLANDNTNIYLAVRATNPRAIEKIMNTGVAFIVNGFSKKELNVGTNVSVVYPVSMRRYAHGILVNAGTKASWSGLPNKRSFPETLTRTDSSVAKANDEMKRYAKNIKVKGIKEISDSLLTIQNGYGIGVAAIFDINGNYSYELKIPLKYLGLSSNHFSYNIFLKGFDSGNTYRQRDPNTGRFTDQELSADPDLEGDKNFWGEYTLAKAP